MKEEGRVGGRKREIEGGRDRRWKGKRCGTQSLGLTQTTGTREVFQRN